MSKWTTGYIHHITHWTPSLFSLTVMADIQPFIAGQFTQLSLEIDGQRIQRPYSFINAPNQNTSEFYIATIEHGKLTPYLQQLRSGDQIQITHQSTGYFTLNEVPDCETLWMIATGTGIAPYLSMLQQKTDLARFKQIVLIHAVRYRQDLCYLPLMQQLQRFYQGKLSIQTVISRESYPNSLYGRVPQLIANGQLERTIGIPISAEQSHIMLCGNPAMVNDTISELKQRGLSKHLRRKPGHITSERYW